MRSERLFENTEPVVPVMKSRNLLTFFLVGCFIGSAAGCVSDSRYLDMQKKLSVPYAEMQAAAYITEETPATIAESSGRNTNGQAAYLPFKQQKNQPEKTVVVSRWVDDKEAARSVSGDSSIEVLKDVALARNPALKAAAKKLTAIRNRYRQVESLENIMSQYNSFIMGANLSKKPPLGFPFPGSETLKKSIVAKEVEMAKLVVEQEEVRIVSGIEKEYASLLYLDELIRIEKDNLRLLHELETLVSTGYGTGKKRFDYLIRVQMESSRLSNNIISLEHDMDTVTASINRYLSLPVNTRLTPEKVVAGDSTGHNLDELYKVGLEQNQSVDILRRRIEKSELAIRLGEEMAYPDLDPALFETDGNGPPGKMRVWFARNDSYLAEARARLAGLKKELDAKNDRLVFEIKELYVALDKSERDIALYKDKLIGQAKRTLEATMIAYQAGDSDFIELLDTQVLWLETNKGLIQAEKEFAHNIAKMKKLLGGKFGRA